MWIVSSITVRGTPITSYFVPSSGYSVTSTMCAVIRSLSMANWYASNTARGQYGQVGVLNTWIVIGLVSFFNIFLVSGVSPDWPPETILMLSIRLPNS